MPDADTILTALGDPTRRSILERLTEGPLAVGALADHLPVSRPAVSQHLRVLREAGLVAETVVGTRHLYRVDTTGLRAVHAWLDRFWTTTLDNFTVLAEQQAAADAVSEAERALDTPGDHDAQP